MHRFIIIPLLINRQKHLLMKKENLRNGLLIIFGATLISGATAWATTKALQPETIETQIETPVLAAQFINTSDQSSAPTSFTTAAEHTINTVVHVKTKFRSSAQQGNNQFFEYFFGRPSQPRQQEQMGSGSGVIISPDGYIVTNNHVINGATNIEVTLNDKRTYEAVIIGTDPSTDLALIKVDANDLQPITFGNSDDLLIGEWVLAVGNPFNLTSTVTAGIVSAKARNINILNNDMKIESFIQTDAAVNPGNSGGALVNTRGELVGINTAIASQTGSYAGYAFAVPTSIVAKVVSDLKEFGIVQRAILGVQIRDIDAAFAKESNLPTLAGAYVAEVMENSSAGKAGIKKGDIITTINNVKINSVSQLQEQVGRYRPGDKIQVGYLRNNKEAVATVELTNRAGNTDVVKAVDMSILGAKFAPLSNELKAKFRLAKGLQVTELEKNSRLGKSGIQKGYIILKVNNTSIGSEEELSKIVEKALNSSNEDKALFISGAYPNGQIAHYAVDLNN